MIEPTAKAFRFVIDGQNQQYDAYIELIDPNGFGAYVDCRYRAIGTTGGWVWLAGPDLGPVDTTENTDASFDACIDIINAKIAEVFGDVEGGIPLKGIERVEWLIRVGIKEVGNVISRI